MGSEHDRILNQLRQELSIPFFSPNDPRLLQRRQRLRKLFGDASPQDAKQLHAQLGMRATSESVSMLFHGRLATATRMELLRILELRIQKQPPPPPSPAVKPEIVFPDKPLPENSKDRFKAALDALEQKVNASGDPRTNRFRCWISKLKANADDRVILWPSICPRISGAIGAALIVGACDITAGTSVNQKALEAAIKSVQDVENADRQLGFITHMRTDILFTSETMSESLHLENFRQFHDRVGQTIDNLDKWANNGFSGSSAMPPAYVSIKAWIVRRQRDATSVYSCL